MARTNARYWMPKYLDDFGNEYQNLSFKIKEDAPKFSDVAQVGFLTSSIYTPRGDAPPCSNAAYFEPRHLLATFNNGMRIKFPVPRPDVITPMIKVLKPSVLANFVPGEGENEAICIDLVGERWSLVPPSIVGLTQAKMRQNPLNAGNAIGPLGLIGGDFEATPGKTSYSYDYSSDVSEVGKISLKFAIQNDSDLLHGCQREGMTNYSDNPSASICSATSLGITARRFIIKAAAEVDTNFILPGGNKGYTVSRAAPVSGIDGNILPGSDQAKSVADAIRKCAQCLGWEGEDIARVDLLVGSNLI